MPLGFIEISVIDRDNPSVPADTQYIAILSIKRVIPHPDGGLVLVMYDDKLIDIANTTVDLQAIIEDDAWASPDDGTPGMAP